MAYDKDEIEQELLNVIKDNKLVFLDHAFGFTKFSGSTAYNYELEKLESIKDAIRKNRNERKNTQIQKWIDSDNATLQIAAYRLMSTPEEHRLLNQSYVENKNYNQEMAPLTAQEIEEAANKLNEDY